MADTRDDIYWANRDPRSSSSVPDIDAALQKLVEIVEEHLAAEETPNE